MAKRGLIGLVFLWCWFIQPIAAVAAPQQATQSYRSARDSIRLAQLAEQKRLADSVRRVQDSLSMQYIGFPDPGRRNLLADSIRSLVVVEDGDVLARMAAARLAGMRLDAGQAKAQREPWVIYVIGLLLLLLGIVRVAFPGQVMAIVQAFFNDRMLSQINKEDTLYSSWPFIFLYILFGFAVGLFVYLCNRYYLGHSGRGMDTFLAISVSVMALFIVKILITRFLGFVFDIQRVVREYVSILYLSYFNAALVFLPIVLILSLVPHNQLVWLIPVALCIVLGLFIFRFSKTANGMLTNYRFPKFYLFTYLCCLEIAPVLILIKVLGN